VRLPRDISGLELAQRLIVRLLPHAHDRDSSTPHHDASRGTSHHDPIACAASHRHARRHPPGSGGPLRHDPRRLAEASLRLRRIHLPHHPGGMPEGTLRAVLTVRLIDQKRMIRMPSHISTQRCKGRKDSQSMRLLLNTKRPGECSCPIGSPRSSASSASLRWKIPITIGNDERS